MESLVANYASSDEEEEEEAQQRQQTLPSPSPAIPTSSSSASLLFSSLPNPKSSSSSSPSSSPSLRFFSLPQPKQQKSGPNIAPLLETQVENGEANNGLNPKPSIKTKSSSSLFSSLPQPKTLAPSPDPPAPKRVVQFRPPIIPSAASHPTHDSDDDEEEEEEKERKRRVESESQLESSSVKSFLSSIPAPRNSSSGVLGGGFLPSASSASSRRSVIENQAPPPASSSGEDQIQEENQVPESYAGYRSGFDPSAGGYVDYGSYESGGGGGGGVDQNAVVGDASGYGSYYGDYGNQGDHVEYGQYGNSWADGSAAGAPPHTVGFGGGGVVAIPGKRRRNEIPTEIVEVKQEELIKNRPREDQAKLTGVAFGPAYQPASTKGKPSKLHKRKHQIGSLYFDMKQKEMELAERRSKGFLTKAETQAKYGW